MERNIEVKVNHIKTMNLAMQQNYVPVIRNIVIENQSEVERDNLSLKIQFSPDYAYDYSLALDNIMPHKSIEINPIRILLNTEYLFSLTERLVGNIHISLFEKEELIYKGEETLEILAFDEWSGLYFMPELIAAFVTPNHPTMVDILQSASKYLERWKLSPSFTGYQTKSPDQVKLQMASIYHALKDINIVYNNPPASYERVGQRIRLPHSVVETRMGTCLDLSVLYASCLEAVGIHPLLIFIKGHAFVGAWLEEETFPDCMMDDMSALEKRMVIGTEEIIVLECTDLVAGRQVEFDTAVTHGRDKLLDMSQFDCVIDIKRTRTSGIRPIPLKLDQISKFNDRDESGIKSENNLLYNTRPKELEKIVVPEVVEGKEILTRQKVWERKLLDFSLRNTLLNFRQTKSAIQLIVSNLAELENKLWDGKDFNILEMPVEWANTSKDSKLYALEHEKDYIQTIAMEEFKQYRIRTFLQEHELEYHMKNLYRMAKLSIEESGSNTLFLALGFLRWYENDLSEKARYAPVVLIPVDIVRNTRNKGHLIRSRQEDAQINITLLEYLKQDHGISISGLENLKEDEHGIDLPSIFYSIRQCIMSKKRWNIEETAYLGLFSFGQFVMWNDIRSRSKELEENQVVSSLIKGKMNWTLDKEWTVAKELDKDMNLMDMAIPVSADSSQMVAIRAASMGESFVLHGPPGTGKSQTITNMIANALYQGKSVLFVAEKMAALNVVKNRLANIGLDPFTLELHSNKTNKSAVLSELNKALEVGRYQSPKEYEQVAQHIHELRSELNIIMDELHKERRYGSSLYDMIERYKSLEEYKGLIAFDRNIVTDIKKEDMDQMERLIREYAVIIADIGSYKNHDLRGIHLNEYSLDIRNSMEEDTHKLIQLLKETRADIDKFVGYYDYPHSMNKDKLELFIQAYEVSKGEGILLDGLFLCKYRAQFSQVIEELIQLGLEYNELLQWMNHNFESSIFEYDIDRAKLEWIKSESSWFLAKFLTQKRLVKELNLYSKLDKVLKDNIVSIYNKFILLNQKKKRILETTLEIQGAISPLYQGVNSDWSQLKKSLDKTIRMSEILSTLYSQEDKINDEVKASFNGQYEASMEKSYVQSKNFIIKLHEYNSKYKCKLGYEDGDMYVDNMIVDFMDQGTLDQVDVDNHGINKNGMDNDGINQLEEDKDKVHKYSKNNWLDGLKEKLEQYKSGVSELRNMVSFNLIDEKLCKNGLRIVSDSYKFGKVTSDNIMNAFWSNMSYQLVISTITSASSLSNFYGNQYDNMIKEYEELIQKYQTLTIEELVARLSANIPFQHGDNTAASSELGILKRAIKNNGRMLPLRKLFDQIPTLLRKLTPCMLMSPISVAQYIDPSFPKFDLVIFDEASQLPTSEAVGTIARGKNVVIVGDPKQLPPTSFFSSNHYDEDNSDVEDLESLLDDCLAISMPEEHLKWHYRSKHESLIAYSNMKYYDNKLYTFPSKTDLKSEVRLVQLEGFYDKGKTKQNIAEGKAIVAEIIRRLQDPILREESIGVVTFNSAQQNLIDDLLYEELKNYPELEEYDRASKEPIFIKNLENVQGDERDVILFSVGYGPDKEGNVSMNFGPLNRDGGWRRLNVAISRARKSMTVYSVLRADQINLSRTRAEGIAGLKGFLEFAAKGKVQLPTLAGSKENQVSVIAKDIGECLENLGYGIKYNVGSSKFKVDIGVVSSENADTYVLGILLDGTNAMVAATARDRYVLQPQVLTGLGWNVIRIWTLDYLDDKEKVLKKIREQLVQYEELQKVNKIVQVGIVKNQGIDNRYKKNFNTDNLKRIDTNIIERKSQVYSVHEISVIGNSDSFYLTSSKQNIVQLMKDIIELESPISKKAISRKVLAAYGMSRGGARVDNIIMNALENLSIHVSKDEDREFYWRANQDPNRYDIYRTESEDGYKRSMDEVASEEILVAMKEVINEQISLSEEDLIRETAKKFGYNRLGNIIESSISYAVNKGIQKGDLIRFESGKIGGR